MAGIIALDADIVGLQEIENDIRDDDGSRRHDAVLTLVEGFNAAEGAGTWAWVGEAAAHGGPSAYNDYPVRNEIIYRTSEVTPVGAPVALRDIAFDQVRPLPGLRASNRWGGRHWRRRSRLTRTSRTTATAEPLRWW